MTSALAQPSLTFRKSYFFFDAATRLNQDGGTHPRSIEFAGRSNQNSFWRKVRVTR